MDTTTPDSGAEQAQPQESAAVTADIQEGDLVISRDENGTPAMVPATSQSESATDDAVSEEPTKETQAEAEPAKIDNSEVVDWAKKKGLEINPDNPNEVKLAKMQRDAERKMHEATTRSSVQPPELLPEAEVDNPVLQQVVKDQNVTKLQLYVRDWFEANPELKEHRTELQQIAIDRPWLQDMDDVKAHFLANPSREAQLRKDGGREALTNLAQKQSQVPPGANATNSGVYESSQITSSNVYDLVDKNDQAWFEKNHDAINKAMSGK